LDLCVWTEFNFLPIFAAGSIAMAQAEPPTLQTHAHGHPTYPQNANGQPARVLLDITVTAQGLVREARIIELDREEPEREAFVQAATEYVKSLSFHPATSSLLDGFDVVSSVGLGARSTDAQALSSRENAPFARVFASELGLAYENRAPWHLEARAFGFYTRVGNDMLFDSERGRNVPIGSSQRFGAAVTSRLRARWLDMMGSLTWTEAFQGGGVFELNAGPRLPFVPRFVARFDAAGRHELTIRNQIFRLGGALGVTYVGPKPLPLSTQSNPIFTLDTSIHAGWRFFELAFVIRNLFDVRNRLAEFRYPSNFEGPDVASSMRAERHFAAGPPRTFLFTFSVNVDPEGNAGG
jgi:hypothetical protein